MTAVVEVASLTKRFGSVRAVSDATFTVNEHSVCGLLGRNGAGKTTLMQLLTGQEFASHGSIALFGENPVENANALGRTCFNKESQAYPDGFKGKHVLQVASWVYPHWNGELAHELVGEFDVPLNRRMKKLSRGQRSAIGVVVGIASRAELTIFDEPYAGLDAVARQLFMTGSFRTMGCILERSSCQLTSSTRWRICSITSSSSTLARSSLIPRPTTCAAQRWPSRGNIRPSRYSLVAVRCSIGTRLAGLPLSRSQDFPTPTRPMRSSRVWKRPLSPSKNSSSLGPGTPPERTTRHELNHWDGSGDPAVR